MIDSPPRIFKTVIASDLAVYMYVQRKNFKFLKAKTIILISVSFSAGGIGVLQNIDRIASMVASSAERVEVRGIVDSAWFLDAPKKGSMCKEKNENGCSPNSMFKEAVK